MSHDWTYDSLPRVDKPVREEREAICGGGGEEEAVARMPGRMIRPKNGNVYGFLFLRIEFYLPRFCCYCSVYSNIRC